MAPWDSQKFFIFFIEDGVPKIILYWGPWDLYIYKSVFISLLGDEVPNIIILGAAPWDSQLLYRMGSLKLYYIGDPGISIFT